MSHALVVAGTLFGSYLILWTIEYIWHFLIGAPKVIHTGCLTEIQGLGDKIIADVQLARAESAKELAEINKAFADERGQWARGATDMNNSLAECRELLARKHPRDEYLESKITTAMQALDPREESMVRWIFDIGRANRGQVQQGRFPNPETINEKTGLRLIAWDSHCPGNGTVEMDRFYYINPVMELALKNVLHPPPRPVTPLQR